MSGLSSKIKQVGPQMTLQEDSQHRQAAFYGVPDNESEMSAQQPYDEGLNMQQPIDDFDALRHQSD